MLISHLVALSVASLGFMIFNQTRTIGAMCMIIHIILKPILLLATALVGGVGYYYFKQ